MATYKCLKCGIHKNDTLNSQLNTSLTCDVSDNNTETMFHKWNKIAEEDWDFN